MREVTLSEKDMASRSKNPTPATTRPAAPRAPVPAPVAERVSLNPSHSSSRPVPNDEQIRARAYYLWEQAGKPDCDGVQFWLEAERELCAPR
jgi:hypothetical protein